MNVETSHQRQSVMIPKKTVLLINAEGVQAICMARSLRKQGHHVIGFCNHKMTSGYATRWLSEKQVSPDVTLHRNEFEAFCLPTSKLIRWMPSFHWQMMVLSS